MIWLVVSIAAWGVVHSWLASTGFRAAMRGALGPRFARLYRLLYNAFAVVSFVPILLLAGLNPGPLLYAVRAPWLYLMLAGQAAAVLCLAVALLQTDAAGFIGLRQLLQGETPPKLVTSGFYGWTRHPLYLFGLVTLWLTPLMTRNMLVAYIALTAYLVIGAIFEERKLRREFGSEYEAYCERTPMFIPIPVRRRP